VFDGADKVILEIDESRVHGFHRRPLCWR